MTNDTNTINTFDPKWYKFWAANQESLYCWFDSEEDAQTYEEILNEGKEINLYSFYPLDAEDFREIAGDESLSDADCETKADEWLQDVCVMISEGLQDLCEEGEREKEREEKRAAILKAEREAEEEYEREQTKKFFERLEKDLEGNY